MSSSDASFDSSSDSETAETEIEYNLEVEVMSHASKQKYTSDDDEPEDVFVNEPLAGYNWLAQYEAEREKRTRTRRETMPWICPFSLFGLLLHLKTNHLSWISFLSTKAKIIPN